MKPTPITDALELSIEGKGARDVPVRVYRKMRELEENNQRLIEVVRRYLETAGNSALFATLADIDNDARELLSELGADK